MTNPYIAATQDQRVADEVAIQGLRTRIVEAIDFAKKLQGGGNFIGNLNFIADTTVLLDEALETLAPTEAAIQEGLALNGQEE